MQELLLIVLLALAVLWLVVRVRANKAATSKKPASDNGPKKSSPYHAVSITYSENACAAATEMTGRRFLASAAPRLPLPECDALECRCRFTHHDDRRSGRDRRSPFTAAGFGGGTGTFEKERRARADRRKDDLDIF